MLVHNKVDLADECQRIKKSSGEEIAKKLKVAFHTTSVMRDQGVNEVFKRLGNGVIFKSRRSCVHRSKVSCFYLSIVPVINLFSYFELAELGKVQSSFINF